MKDDDVDLEALTQNRHLILTIDDETGGIEMDDSPFAPWELVGIAEWLKTRADQMLAEEAEED